MTVSDVGRPLESRLEPVCWAVQPAQAGTPTPQAGSERRKRSSSSTWGPPDRTVILAERGGSGPGVQTTAQRFHGSARRSSWRHVIYTPRGACVSLSRGQYTKGHAMNTDRRGFLKIAGASAAGSVPVGRAPAE